MMLGICRCLSAFWLPTLDYCLETKTLKDSILATATARSNDISKRCQRDRYAQLTVWWVYSNVWFESYQLKIEIRNKKNIKTAAASKKLVAPTQKCLSSFTDIHEKVGMCSFLLSCRLSCTSVLRTWLMGPFNLRYEESLQSWLHILRNLRKLDKLRKNTLWIMILTCYKACICDVGDMIKHYLYR